jgi:hypothetical protein
MATAPGDLRDHAQRVHEAYEEATGQPVMPGVTRLDEILMHSLPVLVDRAVSAREVAAAAPTRKHRVLVITGFDGKVVDLPREAYDMTYGADTVITISTTGEARVIKSRQADVENFHVSTVAVNPEARA